MKKFEGKVGSKQDSTGRVCGEESHIRGYKTSFMAKREEDKQKNLLCARLR